MKFVDEVFRVDPEQADLQGPSYERYRVAVKWLAVGVVGEALGLAAYSLGVKNGLDISAGALPVHLLGMTGLAIEQPRLSGGS